MWDQDYFVEQQKSHPQTSHLEQNPKNNETSYEGDDLNMPNECCYRHRCCYMICKRLSNRFMIANIATSVLFIGLISALIFSFLPY